MIFVWLIVGVVLLIGFFYFLRLTFLRYRFVFQDASMLMFFGLPGSGKSTLCAEIVRQICLVNSKLHCPRGIDVYTNFPVKGSFKLDRSMIGSYDFRKYNDRALLLIDEASTVYFKRNAMNKVKDKSGKMVNEFSDKENIFHSMHRHYKTMEILFGQSWNGVDLRLRELSTGLFYVEPSRLPFLIKIRRITKIFSIDENHQPVDGYDFAKWSSRYVWAPRAWKLFDTYEAPEMPILEPESWFLDDCPDVVPAPESDQNEKDL